MLLLRFEFNSEEECDDDVEDDDVMLLSRFWFSMSENLPAFGDSESVLYLDFVLSAIISWSAIELFSSDFLGEPEADDDDEETNDKWFLLLLFDVLEVELVLVVVVVVTALARVLFMKFCLELWLKISWEKKRIEILNWIAKWSFFFQQQKNKVIIFELKRKSEKKTAKNNN